MLKTELTENKFVPDPYLTTRLILSGAELEYDHRYIYALAEACRLLQYMEITRYRFILDYFIAREKCGPAARLISVQSGALINLLTTISDSSDLQSELSLYRQYGYHVNH